MNDSSLALAGKSVLHEKVAAIPLGETTLPKPPEAKPMFHWAFL